LRILGRHFNYFAAKTAGGLIYEPIKLIIFGEAGAKNANLNQNH
jgi:hypothetical protein